MGRDAVIDREIIRRIGDVLRGIGYTESAVTDLIGPPTVPMWSLPRRGPVLRRTAGGSPLETIVRLFMVHRAVDEALVAAVVAPTDLADWYGAGLLEHSGGEVRATVTIRTHGPLLVAHDITRAPGDAGLAPDHVMGLSPSTLGLADLTIRRPNRSALDLGTGSGFQAMLAAAHSDRVVATDVNERAIWLARLNVELNAITNVEVRRGDLFDPVEGETFDLVVSNPPFIIGSDIAHQFLSSGRQGDDLCRELASGVGARLSEGGYCQFLANWMSVEGRRWTDRVAGWFEGSGCDAWVIRASVDRPDEYASTWAATVTDDPEAYERRFEAWMRQFDADRVDSVGYGLVTMRRRSSGPAHWRRFDDVSDLFDTGTGDDLVRLIDMRTWLEATDDRSLLATTPRFSASSRVLLRVQLGEQGMVNEDLVLKRMEGLRFGTPGSSDVLRLVSQFDGTRTLAEAIGAVLRGGEATDAVVSEIIGSTRELMASGLVEPVDRAGGPVG